MGESVTSSLRLSILAFVTQSIDCAEVIMRSVDEWRTFDFQIPKTEILTTGALTSDMRESLIAASLKQIMENLCTIAVVSLLPHRS